jgi:hypothetical protein
MRFPTPIKLAACLLSGVLALAAFQTSDSDKEKVKDNNKASLEGKISHAITGEPVKKVSVILSSRGKNITAETDDKGVFTFDNLEPGRYTLAAQKNGFAPGAYGARGNSNGGDPAEPVRGPADEGLELETVAQRCNHRQSTRCRRRAHPECHGDAHDCGA